MLAIFAVLVLAVVPSPAPDAPVAPDRPFTQDGIPPVDPLASRDATGPTGGEIVGSAPKTLDLGAYKLFAPPPKPSDVIAPRFDTQVEVLARAPRDPNVVMADWWRHWNFEYSIYGRGINIQQPMPGGGFNILPLIEWLGKKAREREENRQPEE
jgi:hypothetical protein